MTWPLQSPGSVSGAMERGERRENRGKRREERGKERRERGEGRGTLQASHRQQPGPCGGSVATGKMGEHVT